MDHPKPYRFDNVMHVRCFRVLCNSRYPSNNRCLCFHMWIHSSHTCPTLVFPATTYFTSFKMAAPLRKCSITCFVNSNKCDKMLYLRNHISKNKSPAQHNQHLLFNSTRWQKIKWDTWFWCPGAIYRTTLAQGRIKLEQNHTSVLIFVWFTNGHHGKLSFTHWPPLRICGVTCRKPYWKPGPTTACWQRFPLNPWQILEIKLLCLW